jgi:hypothetical protein
MGPVEEPGGGGGGGCADKQNAQKTSMLVKAIFIAFFIVVACFGE